MDDAQATLDALCVVVRRSVRFCSVNAVQTILSGDGWFSQRVINDLFVDLGADEYDDVHRFLLAAAKRHLILFQKKKLKRDPSQFFLSCDKDRRYLVVVLLEGSSIPHCLVVIARVIIDVAQNVSVVPLELASTLKIRTILHAFDVSLHPRRSRV